MKVLKVDAIKNGTVIDHIAAGRSLEVAKILDLSGNDEVMVGINLSSKKAGKKDIIKIENKELSVVEVQRIALVAPEATLIIIQNYEVKKKEKISIPTAIEALIQCPNPTCVTNQEHLDTLFTINQQPLQLRCQYCEKSYQVGEVNFLL